MAISDSELQKLKDGIIESFKANIGEAWAVLSEQDKKLLEMLAKDAAKLQVKKLLSNENLEKEINIVNASLLNLTIAKTFKVQQVFWNSAQRAITLIISTLLKSAISAI